MNKLTCPNCDHDMKGDPIPLEDQELYGMEFFTLWVPIYNESLETVDRHSCPFCGYEEFVKFN